MAIGTIKWLLIASFLVFFLKMFLRLVEAHKTLCTLLKEEIAPSKLHFNHSMAHFHASNFENRFNGCARQGVLLEGTYIHG